MYDSKLKIISCIIILIFYLVITVGIVILYFIGGFLFSEMTTLLAIVCPLVGAYLTASVRYYTDNKYSMRKGRKLNPMYVALSLIIPSALFVFMTVIILMKSLNIGLDSFDNLQTMLGLINTAFGSYAAILIMGLYGAEDKTK